MDSSFSTSIDLRGYHQLFTKAPPMLQKMAESKIAISLWYNFFFNGNFNTDEDSFGDTLDEDYRKTVKKSIQHLNLPPVIEDEVKRALKDVEYEINGWISYHMYETWPDSYITILRDYLRCCVWKSDGKIDYRQTAEKMLFLDQMSPFEKFGIMCRYCLENKIKNVNLDEELGRYFEEVDFYQSPLMFYWICYLYDDLKEIPVDKNFESIESFMITKKKVDNWSAVEYFWNRLSEQEQITKACELMIWPNFQKQLLSRMNDSQLRQVFFKIPGRILGNLWVYFGEREAAVVIWTQIKSLISCEQFSTLIRSILNERIFSDEYVDLMIELWNSADDHLKRYLLENERDIIIRRYFSSRNIHHPVSYTLKFLYAVLSYSSPDYRRNIFLNYGQNLIVNHHFDEVVEHYPRNHQGHFVEADKIIKLCLPSDDDVLEFKNRMMEWEPGREYCKWLFKTRRYDKYNKFVEFYSPNELVINDRKKSMVDKCKVIWLSEWAAFEKSIDDVYPDAELANNIKQKLVLDSATRYYFCEWRNIDFLRQMIKVCVQILTDEDMIKVKKSLLDEFRSRFMTWYGWKYIDETCWREFSAFCLGSEEKIKEYKSTIPIDEIFAEKLKLMISKHSYEWKFVERVISVMDNSLEWLMVEPDEVRKYKLRRIFEFGDVEIIEDLVAKQKEIARKLLGWFLDNDEEQICKFKNEFSHTKVSMII